MSETIHEEAAESAEIYNDVEIPGRMGNRSLAQLLRNDLSFLPVLVTLILIWAYFGFMTNGLFLVPRNLSNLVLQIATIGVDALGVSLVLIIGEIDLSVAAVGTLGATIMGVLVERAGMPAVPAIIIAIASGALVGLINGILVAVVRMPSFIVTLAASIAYEGLLLFLQFGQSSLVITDKGIIALAGSASSYLPAELGIALPTIAVLVYIISTIYTQFQRRKAGLRPRPTWQIGLQIVLALIITLGPVILFENYLGVPNTTIILVGLMLILWLVLTQTRFGRHIYAVGGNGEAARRAGINVIMLRIMVFMLCSVIAVVGGILESSRETAVASLIDPTLLLEAIAAAVIGGISLYGGRGSVWSILLGILVIGSLANGLALMNQTQAVEEMIQGLVLVIAVGADALIRRSQTRTTR
jgi:D-xylose transport system permease protein